MNILKKDGIYQQLAKLSLPILWGMIAELLYSLADIYFIAAIDKSATHMVSGVGIVFPLIFLLTSVDQGIGSGIATITAIAHGGKDQQTVEKTSLTGYNLSLYSGIVIVILFFILAEPIINGLSGNEVTPAAKDVAIIYLRYSLAGFIFMFLVQARFSVLQGIGQTGLIGIAMIGSTLLNLVLDPIFIFTLKLGVRGAAIATVISQISLWLFINYQYGKVNLNKPKWADLIQLDKVISKRILKIGIPASFTFVILSVSFMVLNKLVSNISEVGLNAYTLVTRLDGILVTPALAFSIGLSIMIGQNYGGGKIDRLPKIFRQGGIVITFFTLLLGVIYMALAKTIFGTMSSRPEVIALASKQVLYLTIPVAVGMSISTAASSCLQALEQATKAMLVTGFRALFITAPLILLLGLLFKPHIYHIWIGIAGGVIGASIIGLGWVNKAFNRIAEESLLPNNST